MIYTAMMVNKNGTDKRHQRVFVESIEDFENITLRIAEALVMNLTLVEVIDVDNVKDIEAESDLNIRSSLNRLGLSFGYISPWQQLS